MRARRIIEGAMFGPDVLNVVRQAFEECWQELAGSFSPSEHEDAREVLARAVMSAAREDSADPLPLREAGMQAMRRSYPVRFGGDEADGKASEG
jgi:hypothetical protein